MKILTKMATEIDKVIDTLAVSSTEKKQIRTQMIETLYQYASELEKQQASIILAETRGNWLQRSWRPIVMLTFTFIVLLGVFIPLPFLENHSEVWDLLEIGVGGYVIGRGIEKVTGKLRKI